MAGVAQHSDFREDPWGRLQRTARFLAGTTYGTAAQAEQACATVRRVHERVRGIAPDGRPYDANDPHLLLWVHVAEVDSFLAAHQRFGARPLDRAEQDQYVSDLARVARELGVPDPPLTVEALRAQLAAYRPELATTAEAREAARFLLLQPPVPLAARGPYTVLGATAVSLLPWWAKVMLRIPPLPADGDGRRSARPDGPSSAPCAGRWRTVSARVPGRRRSRAHWPGERRHERSA